MTEETMPRVGLAVSARRDGKTKVLIDALLAQANSRGIQVEIIESPRAIAELTEQLLSAQATIAEALAVGRRWDELHARGKAHAILTVLSRADTSAYDAAILAARVKELSDAAEDLKARADELFAESDKAWTESEYGKRDTDTEHPGRDALALAANSGAMTRDAEWLKARAKSIEKTETKW